MRIPASGYRLQLSPDFTFDAAREAAPYLRALGVGDLYLSPILAARPESAHGYERECQRGYGQQTSLE